MNRLGAGVSKDASSEAESLPQELLPPLTCESAQFLLLLPCPAHDRPGLHTDVCGRAEALQPRFCDKWRLVRSRRGSAGFRQSSFISFLEFAKFIIASQRFSPYLCMFNFLFNRQTVRGGYTSIIIQRNVYIPQINIIGNYG